MAMAAADKKPDAARRGRVLAGAGAERLSLGTVSRHRAASQFKISADLKSGPLLTRAMVGSNDFAHILVKVVGGFSSFIGALHGGNRIIFQGISVFPRSRAKCGIAVVGSWRDGGKAGLLVVILVRRIVDRVNLGVVLGAIICPGRPHCEHQDQTDHNSAHIFASLPMRQL
jgi:hypothetical protein